MTAAERNFRRAARFTASCLLATLTGLLLVVGLIWAGIAPPSAGVVAGTCYSVIVSTLLMMLSVGIMRTPEPKQEDARHAWLRPQRVLITVAMPEGSADSGHSAQLLAESELAIDVYPEERRGKVVKHRHGRTDWIEVDVVVVKVPS